MASLIGLALRYRTVTLLLVVLFGVGGSVAVTTLDREMFPSIEVPYLVVSAVERGAGPTEVAEDLARPIEGVLAATEGIRHVRSTSLEGFAIVVAEYRFGTDMDDREREVREGLAAVPRSPANAPPSVERISPDSFPVLSLAVASDDAALLEAYVGELVPAVEAAGGVGAVTVSGRPSEVVAVIVDPARLADAGLTVGAIEARLAAAEVSIPVGGVAVGGQQLPIRVTRAVDDVDDIESIPVGTAPGGGAVVLGDVADVDRRDGGAGQTISRLDGQPAVTIDIVKAQSANTVEVAENTQEVLGDLAPPAGVTVAEVVNQAPEINRAVSELARDALIGIALAVIVILLFLRSVRGTVVAGMSIPMSLLIGFVVMWWQGISLNILTLGALSVAAARVIDDSIVVLENIHRLLENGVERSRAVLDGTAQMVPAITASTATTVAVFLPIAFVSGLVGQMFVGFALTITFALLASLLVAVTVVPVLAQTFLRASDDRRGDAGERALGRLYRRPLQWALDHRTAVVASAILLLVGSVLVARTVPTSHFPAIGSEVVSVHVAAPPGTSLAATADAVADLEAGVAAVDGVERFTTVIGSSPDALSSFAGGGGSGGANTARLTVALDGDADVDAVIAGLEGAIATTELQGTVTEAAVAGPNSSRLSIQVTGDDFEAVAGVAADLADALVGVDGLDDIGSNVAVARPEVVVTVDDDAAAARGLSAPAVAGLVRSSITPTPIGTVTLGEEVLDVVLAVALPPPSDPDALAALPLGPGVVLGDVATLAQADSPTGVTTYDGERSAEVTAVITSDDTGPVTADVESVIDDLALPEGVEVSLGGASEILRESFSSLVAAMLVAVALVYLAMVATFGSLLTPFVVLFSLPLAAIGAFPALAATGRELGMPAMIGVLMLIGIVVTNAIVMLELVERLKREEGLSTREALAAGAEIRLRPILMTAVVTVTALIPLALGLSEGGVLSSSLATVVIGGMVSSTFLTLFVVPVVYSLADGARRRLHGVLGASSTVA